MPTKDYIADKITLDSVKNNTELIKNSVTSTSRYIRTESQNIPTSAIGDFSLVRIEGTGIIDILDFFVSTQLTTGILNENDTVEIYTDGILLHQYFRPTSTSADHSITTSLEIPIYFTESFEILYRKKGSSTQDVIYNYTSLYYRLF